MGYELYRRKRGGPWSVYFLTREGGRFRRSTKQTNKRLATAVADEWYRKRADPTYQAAHETSVQQAVRGLMQAKEDAGVRPATRKFYAQKCGHIARIFGLDLPLARIDAKLVDSYIRDRKREGAKPHTVAKELTALRQMLKHARRRGEFDKELSQVMPIGFATGYKPRERRITMQQAWDLVAALPEGPSRYVAFVCATTARDAAVPRARGKHLTSDGVLVLDGKTARSTRLVPVPPVLFAFVNRAFEGVGPDAMVAPGISSIRHALDRACKRLGRPHISPNDLRRSVAHWLLEAGVPRDVAAAYMGHANTKMLDMVYGKLDPKELGAALARALPPASDAEKIERIVDAIDDVPLSDDDAKEAVRRLGIDVPKWAEEIRKRVDVVWTTPAQEGDTSDKGHDVPSDKSCAGGESDSRHADFQSASKVDDFPYADDGSEAGVEPVWNSARHLEPQSASPQAKSLACTEPAKTGARPELASTDRVGGTHLESRGRLTLSPITRDEANAFVEQHHRHHGRVVGHLFALAASSAGNVVGVAIVGRPVARRLDGGLTAEVTRVCTVGHRNVCSFLYGACWRAARALGYRRLITYTLPEEGGASLRGAGWTCIGEAGGGSWSRDSRPRVDTHPTQAKLRWERSDAPPPTAPADSGDAAPRAASPDTRDTWPLGASQACPRRTPATSPPGRPERGHSSHWLDTRAGVYVDALLAARAT